MKKISILSSLLLLLSGCGPQFMMGTQRNDADYLLAELKAEITDLKQQSKHHEIEFQLLDERLDKVSTSKTTDTGNKTAEFAKLERKVAELERLLAKTKEELKEVASYVNQNNSSWMQTREKLLSCEKQMAHQNDVLGEVAKLKGTLSSLSKAMQEPVSSNKTYRVRSGDSLEKIARLHNCSIEQIKNVNGLRNDTIMIGQELKITHDTK